MARLQPLHVVCVCTDPACLRARAILMPHSVAACTHLFVHHRATGFYMAGVQRLHS